MTWLEYQGSGALPAGRRTGPAGASNGAELTTEQGIRLAFDPSDAALVRAGAAGAVDLKTFDLALRAARLATHAGFDRLIALPLVRDIELLEHQIRTAKTVLRRFRGRAMLCDEVGLGKTIEAGLILSELMMRGLVRSVLVLVPPSLIEQWQGEMRRKFSIELISHDDPAFRERGTAAWGEFDRVIASIHTAKREPHRVGDPGPEVGHRHRRRGPSPAQPQHPGLEVRQRAPEAVHPAADGDPGAEQPRGAVQPGHAAGAGAPEHGAAVPAPLRRPPRQADAAQRRRAARACWPR